MELIQILVIFFAATILILAYLELNKESRSERKKVNFNKLKDKQEENLYKYNQKTNWMVLAAIIIGFFYFEGLAEPLGLAFGIWIVRYLGLKFKAESILNKK